MKTTNLSGVGIGIGIGIGIGFCGGDIRKRLRSRFRTLSLAFYFWNSYSRVFGAPGAHENNQFVWSQSVSESVSESLSVSAFAS